MPYTPNLIDRVTTYVSGGDRGWCIYSSDELFQRSREGCFGDKNQNNTQVSAETVRHESTYIVLFLTGHKEPINDDNNDGLYNSSPCLTRSVFVLLMTSQSIADDVTMTTQLCRGHVNSDI